ncbi:hypothetical protein ACV566_13410 [Staphylococcus aureus]
MVQFFYLLINALNEYRHNDNESPVTYTVLTEMIRLGGRAMFKKLINKKNTINNYNEESSSSNIPEHIAIIIDGNGRWAKKRKMPH